jgi:hypothetical protein
MGREGGMPETLGVEDVCRDGGQKVTCVVRSR